ncbi:MAG: ABC transporter permease [Deltaproteobacteria bacterium]|nr:ABC transporter permease [Deltaproteobacteria bacterium]
MMFHSMWNDLIASQALAWRLFIRNISARFRESFLGYIWAFLPPIVTTLTFVFLKSQNIFISGKTEVPYPVYVMVGTLLWQGFVDALNSPIKIITSSKSILAKIYFPRESLILAGFYEVLFYFIIRLILMIGVLLWYQVQIHPVALLAPFCILILMALGLMIGILLTPIAFLYQDVSWGVNMATTFWFFITPVVYPPPTSWPASLLCNLNPVSPILITTRELIVSNKIIRLDSFILISCFIFAFMLIGWLVYRVAMPHLVERIGS